MAEFPYASDIGVRSIEAIQSAARMSGVPFTVTSTYRPGDPGYHGKQNAVDMASTPDNMVKLAQYFMGMSGRLLELIHSGGGGYFVKNGKVVDRSYYGTATVAAHYNHVHVAATLSGLSGTGGSNIHTIANAPIGSNAKGGCLLPALFIIPSLGGFAWITLQIFG